MLRVVEIEIVERVIIDECKIRGLLNSSVA
jgi:hypothetical protein